MHCTSPFKYMCFKMGNIPSCSGIISKHMYRLVLHKMAPVCMKITKNCLGEDPQAPFNHNCFRYYYTLIFKHHLHIHYMHMHITVFYKFAKIFTNYMENPVLPLFLRNIPIPPPPLFSLIPHHQLFFLFPNFVADENKYFGIKIPENKFSGRAHAENNLSR